MRGADKGVALRHRLGQLGGDAEVGELHVAALCGRGLMSVAARVGAGKKCRTRRVHKIAVGGEGSHTAAASQRGAPVSRMLLHLMSLWTLLFACR